MTRVDAPLYEKRFLGAKGVPSWTVFSSGDNENSITNSLPTVGWTRAIPQTKGKIMSAGLFTLTLVHVAVSLVGIVSGFAVLHGFLKGKRLEGWTKLFLATTVATSATGFLFPFERLLPSHVFGVVSLVALGLATFARYRRQMTGGWRQVFVIGSVFSQYLNFFVLVVQAFRKVPVLTALAPTQSELPFAVTQLAVLGLFVVLGWQATVRSRSMAGSAN